jgi:hypothetical protein
MVVVMVLFSYPGAIPRGHLKDDLVNAQLIQAPHDRLTTPLSAALARRQDTGRLCRP